MRLAKTLGLSRRLLGTYLLCALAAQLATSAGALWTLHLREQRLAYRRWGAFMEQAAVRTAALHAAGDVAATQRELQMQAEAVGAAYCGIVDATGKYVAHAPPPALGGWGTAAEAIAAQVGLVTIVRLPTGGPASAECRCQLSPTNEALGELRWGVELPEWRSTLQESLEYLPWLLGAPALVVVFGGALLVREVRPLEEVDGQLRQAAVVPPGAPLALTPLATAGAAALGWRRIREAVEGGPSGLEPAGDLQTRLETAAATYQQSQFEAILQHLAEGVAVTDAEGRIRFANAAVAALLDEQHDPEALLGAPLVDQLARDAADDAQDQLAQWLAGGGPSLAPLQAPFRSDRVYRVERAPLPTDDGGCVWTLRDVTQQRLAEQSRDQFIDTATHELRTPLANIKAYAEMLATADEIDVEQQKEFCNIINAEVTRLARFVDDLLSISSMEVGTLTVDLHTVDLQRLFDEVADKMRPLLEQKQLAFSVVLPPKLQEAKLDKDKIAAVLVNLLGNAAKYTPSGGRVTLRVSIEERTLRIAVEDTGLGVEAEELPRLFEKFFRSKDPRVQAETGTGLGLSLAREVVRAHGGDICAESVMNEGSTFTVWLPLT